MYIEYAAHVDNAVAHTSGAGRLGLSIVGVGIGALVCMSGVGTVACLGAVGLYGGLGMDIGSVVDNFTAPSTSQKIVSGLPTVMLGPQLKHAARAFTDTVADCDGVPVAEGSTIVMLGPERKPMSRRGERLECDGKIVEGIETVLVGGESSAAGQTFNETDPAAVRIMGYFLGIVGIGKSAAEGAIGQAVLGAGELALTAGGQGSAADLSAAIRGRALPTGGNFMDAIDYANTMRKGAAGAVDIGAGLIPQ